MMNRLRVCIVCLMAMVAVPSMAQTRQTDEQLAAYYYDQGEYAQAAQLYETLYQRGHNRYHYQRLFDTYMHMERYKEARQLAMHRQKSAPKELFLWVNEGEVWLVQKQEKKALKCFNQAVERIGVDMQPVADLADAFQRTGRIDYAVLTYRTARRNTGNETLYFNELQTLYQLQHDYESMSAEYFSLLDAQPGALQSVQASMQRFMQGAEGEALAAHIRSELVERVRSKPDSHVYLDMMIWFALQQQDYAFALEQAEAIDVRMPSIGTPQLLRVAKIAHRNGALDVAAEAYRKVYAKGKDLPQYIEARLGELDVAYDQVWLPGQSDPQMVDAVVRMYQDALAELGRNERTVPLLRRYAQMETSRGGNMQEAVDALEDVLEMRRISPRERDETKLELGDLLLYVGQTWDASLLYMQVEHANKNDIIGSEAKFRNARLSYFMHDFQWARSQLEVLRGSTSKLIANDAMELSLLISDNMDDDSTYTTLELFADADKALYRQNFDEAWEGFDAVERSRLSHPLLDEVLLRKAQIRISQQRYAEADSLLQRLVNSYAEDITADDALMLMAQINEEHLGNNDKARQCYERLVIDYPSSLYVEQARKRYNLLKTQ